jgi:hypothetical protein
MKWILRAEREIQTELGNIQTCPSPCEDGTVLVSPPSGTSQRRRCPLLSFGCPYGSGLDEKLDGCLNKLLLGAGIPRRHIDHFDAYIETPALLCANKWGFGGFLVFFGRSGVGKSFGAVWAAKRYLRSVIPDLLDTKTWNRAVSAGENTVWTSANRVVRDKTAILSSCAARLLVMDDLGREGDSPTRRADLSDIVSSRYDAKFPTIVTTELTFGGIAAAYGENTAFKLAEDVHGGGSGGMIADCGDVSLCPDWEGSFDFEEKSAQWGPEK